MESILNKSVRFVKGVGEKRALLFEKLGIFTIHDLITYYPRDFEDRGSIEKIANLEDGYMMSVEATVLAAPVMKRFRRGLSSVVFRVADDTGSMLITFFNSEYTKNIFLEGKSFVFYGKVAIKGDFVQMVNPAYIEVNRTKELCSIFPVYGLTKGLTQNNVRAAIKEALKLVTQSLTNALPQKTRERYKLEDIVFSINNIHFPKIDEDFLRARRSLVFEELLILQLALFSMKGYKTKGENGIAFKYYKEKIDEIKSRLGFDLTDAQERVLEEVCSDMQKPQPMKRLIQGDVGSGKTVLAMLSAYICVLNGYQAALMAPTEILAEQHAESFKELFEELGVRIGFLKGSLTAKQKREELEKIRTGSVDIIIGTHSLIQDEVEFERLGLVITDEQHRFGVNQRKNLSAKGINPDVLVMTATPIPRSLALILYGDLDVSIVDSLPPGRQRVKTFEISESKLTGAYSFIREQVQQGYQAFVVCPLVEDSENVELKSAAQTAADLQEIYLSDCRIGLLHGKMKPREKDEVMAHFVKGEIDVIVATTVVEVGVNVPNATVMLVQNAERFGLAQLHQLRGRVGRSKLQSYCFLVNCGRSRISKERMKALVESNDGFKISDRDLELRGPGDFFGTRQHGLPELKIANLYRDAGMLGEVQELARLILENGALENKESLAILNQEVQKLLMGMR